jgi:hypothetical protein
MLETGRIKQGKFIRAQQPDATESRPSSRLILSPQASLLSHVVIIDRLHYARTKLILHLPSVRLCKGVSGNTVNRLQYLFLENFVSRVHMPRSQLSSKEELRQTNPTPSQFLPLFRPSSLPCLFPPCCQSSSLPASSLLLAYRFPQVPHSLHQAH